MPEMPKSPARTLHPDFPDEPILGAVAGAQLKLTVCRGADGSYRSNRRSPAEVMHRFEAADDLVAQLVSYFSRKKLEFPAWSDATNLERIRLALIQKASEGKWPFSSAEQSWIMDRLWERTGADEAARQVSNPARESKVNSQLTHDSLEASHSPRASAGPQVLTAAERILLTRMQ